MRTRPGPEHIGTAGAAAGDFLGYDPDADEYAPMAVSGDGITGLTSADSSVTITDNGDGTLDLSAPGGGGAASYIGCAAERTTAQSIATAGATFTAVQFNATDPWDTNSIHDPATNNTRFTIPAGMGGKWRFEASVRFAPNSNGQRALQFIKNGTLLSGRYGGQYLNAVGGGLASDFTGATTLNLAAGDYVEVGVYQTSGGALNVDEAFAACQFLG